jgi:hypothetical protein
MATREDRLKSLEGGFSVVANEITGKIDEHTSLLREVGRDVRELGRVQRDQGGEIQEIKARLATMDLRQNRMDEKLDQIIALLSQGKESV